MKPIFITTLYLAVVQALLFFIAPIPVVAEDTTVELVVKVEDEGGHAVSMARVNIYQGIFSGTFVVPPMLQYDTNASGLARFAIPVARGQALKFSIEVGREDMQSENRPIDPGTKFATRMLEKFVLKPRPKVGGTGDKEVITVGIDVQNEKFDFLEGARVLISGGLASERYIGVTNGEGRATIPVWWASASPELAFGVDVSKEGYRDKRINIQLNKQQVGKTIRGGGVVLEMIGAGTIKTTVTVLNKKTGQGVGDATVVLDGGGGSYYSDKTSVGGKVTFYVSKAGGFTVRISQDNYFPFTGEARLLKDQPEIPLEFPLEPKANKDQGEDTIEVTVLGKDSTDEKSKPAPIKGAYVKAGTISAETDEGGVATLTAAFAETQEVTVQAKGYKIKTATVRVNKVLHMSAGSGSATFTLDPELSDNSPVRLLIEVRDVSGKPIPDAVVELLMLSGARAGGDPTDKAGNYTFNSSEFENDLSELRKGLLLKVVAKGYQLIERRSIPADMLKPSIKTGEFLVQLDRNWSDLEKDLAALEVRVKAWSTERFAAVSKAGEDAFIDKALTTRKHAEQTAKEIEAAKEAFGIVTNPGGVTLTRCKKAAELKQDIELCEAEANQKAEEMKRLLDAAGNVAETCSAAGDADVIRANYKDAIKLIAKIGVQSKKAVKDRDELLKLAQETSASTKLLAELDAKLASIGEDKKTAEDNAKKAAEQYGRISDGVKGSNAKRNELYSDFATLKDKYNVNQVAPPAPIQTRLAAIENTLNPKDSLSNEGGKPKQVPESVASAAGVIEGVQGQAEKFIARYRAGGCDIDTMDEVVNGLNTTLTNATGEIGMAGDIMTKATACENKFKEVEVPDLTPLNDLGAMTRAADQVGMKFHAEATSSPPPPGSQRLFGPQNPLAKTKAHRGDDLTIIVYQKLAENNATPTPAVVASATPTPTAADEYVDVPSVASAKDAGAMSKMLGDAGFKAVFNAATPKKKDDELKFSSQDPVGKTKKSDMIARNNVVTVYINQKWQDPESPSPTPTPPETKLGTMPNLIDHTIEEASALLTGNQRIGSDEVGNKLNPEKPLRIYYQYPPAGQPVADNVSITIKRFGDTSSEGESSPTETSPTPSPEESPTPESPASPAEESPTDSESPGTSTSSTDVARFDGKYKGRYTGMAHLGNGSYKQNGAVSFIVSGGTVTITSPGKGSGNVSADGSATFGGGTHDGTSYSFRGSFSSSSGGASASGSWSASFDGGNASGSWSASK